jgi:hypothetical protein
MKPVLIVGSVLLTLCLVVPTASAQGDMRSQLKALQAEPTVRETQEAALRYFKVNQDTVASMRSRAGWKAILPVTEISGGYASSKADEDTVNKEFDPTDAWVLRDSGGTGFDVRGKLTWNLPQLIFNAEELDVASLAGLMEGILKESTRLYFMRRRLQVDMILTPPTDQASLLTKQLRLEELTGLMDAMTGGWFQRELTRSTGQTSQAVPMLPAPTAAAPVRAAVPKPAPPRGSSVMRRRGIEQ